MEGYWIERFNTFNNGLNTKNETDINIEPHLLNAVNHYQHHPDAFPYQTSYIQETSQDKLNR